MKKALLVASVLIVAVISTACINNIAVQELNNKAAEYMQNGDYEAAMSRLQASIDLDATMYQTYYNLGVAAIHAQKYDTAIQALEDGIKLNPEFADFYYSLGVAQISLADKMTDKENDEIENKKTAPEEQKSESIQQDKEKAYLLKQKAVKNLDKYLLMVPSSNDKENIDKMIEESEDFIAEYNNNNKSRETEE